SKTVCGFVDNSPAANRGLTVENASRFPPQAPFAHKLHRQSLFIYKNPKTEHTRGKQHNGAYLFRASKTA
ncbi:MAG: hypothetical protein LBU43_05220, partial [Candidatus Accumulibacter sp.]|nr:hypothetical protein [Accumulibacter sp.]